MIDFADRVAVVTGAGGGLGRQHALLLAARGAAVVVNDPGTAVDGSGTPTSAADQVVAEITAAGGRAVADRSSVATRAGGESIVATAIEKFGRVDVVINNAGILRDKSFHKLEETDLRAVLDVHLLGAFFVTQPAWVHMREQGYGRVVLTSSASGVFGNFGQSNYGAAKMGLVGLLNVLKLEGAKYNIRVNAISPIAVTRMTESMLAALGITAEHFDPAGVSPAVAYLASEACQVSGELWSVGGGSVSRMFVGLAEGFFKHPRQGVLTVEDIEDNLERIRASEPFVIPASIQDEFAKLGAKLFG